MTGMLCFHVYSSTCPSSLKVEWVPQGLIGFLFGVWAGTEEIQASMNLLHSLKVLSLFTRYLDVPWCVSCVKGMEGSIV